MGLAVSPPQIVGDTDEAALERVVGPTAWDSKSMTTLRELGSPGFRPWG